MVLRLGHTLILTLFLFSNHESLHKRLWISNLTQLASFQQKTSTSTNFYLLSGPKSWALYQGIELRPWALNDKWCTGRRNRPKKVKYKNTPDKKSHMVGYTTIILIYYSFKDNLAWIYTSGKITSWSQQAMFFINGTCLYHILSRFVHWADIVTFGYILCSWLKLPNGNEEMFLIYFQWPQLLRQRLSLSLKPFTDKE